MSLDRMRIVLLFASFPLLSFSIVGKQVGTMSNISILSLSDGVPFQMGKVDARRIVHPGVGARLLTLNYAVSEPGHEFPQHVHEYSDDVFLVLEGQVDVRQGNSRRGLFQGQAAFVPAGQVHGTITTGSGRAVLISFQCPPDTALYAGERDSSRPGAAAPEGDISPGAVKLLDFSRVNGFFIEPAMGSNRVAIAHRKLMDHQDLSVSVPRNGEIILFVWQGSISVKMGDRSLAVREKQTLFAVGQNTFVVANDSPSFSIVIQAEALL